MQFAYLSLVGCLNRKIVDVDGFPAEVEWCVEVIAHAQQGRCRLGARIFNALTTNL